MWVVKSFCVAWSSWHKGHLYDLSAGLGSITDVAVMGGVGIPGGSGLGN